jgi:hypothetical protein
MTIGWQDFPLKEIAKPVSRPVPVNAAHDAYPLSGTFGRTHREGKKNENFG